MSSPTEVIHVPQSNAQVVRASDFAPIFSLAERKEMKKQMNDFINDVLEKGVDYGPSPGASKDKKPVLLKPGAEKLCSIFGLTPRFVLETVIEDWTGKDHGGEALFYYQYKCQLYRGERFMGEAIGSSNSWEEKHRYRWVREEEVPAHIDPADLPHRGGMMREPGFAIDKGETTGRYGKPAEYWQAWREAILTKEARPTEWESNSGKMIHGYERETYQYRVSNPNFADVINTCQKIGNKRALVAAVLIVTNCSDAFTQDLDDMPGGDEQHEPQASSASPGAGTQPAGATPTPAAPRAKKGTPQPQEAPLIEHPGVIALMERIGSVSAPKDAIGSTLVDLYNRLIEACGGGKPGENLAMSHYGMAKKIYGDPEEKLDAVRPVLDYLLKFIDKETEKRKK